MAITTIRVHPSIGIARLGNSPDFFIGPIRPRDTTPPAGGYKDPQCRVKRQAAQFRLFAYDENDALIGEITAADATIQWTVHLVNRKAAADPGFSSGGPRNPSITNPADRAKLVIDPGPRTIIGANQNAKFDNGSFTLPGPFIATVPLGEIRTDNDGRLVVLGGSGNSGSPNNTAISELFNNANWYDDVSDGPVSAKVSHPDGIFDAVPSWVIVTPPKFAPQIPNPITLWDRLQQFFIDNALLPPFNDPSPSYVQYIHPILLSARSVHGVLDVGSAHSWSEPVIDPGLRDAIFTRLNPPGDMPMLFGSAKLTKTQYDIMSQWHDGNFTNDWPPVPDPNVTPVGMDRAALEAAVGDAFFPGIEGGEFLVSDKFNYLTPFRLNPAVVIPGKVTERMSLPWQTDFNACSFNWWPPQRPTKVVPSGQSAYVDWSRGVADGAEMVKKWSILGFVLDEGGETFREVDRCDSAFVHLLTPVLNFKDVPQAPMGMSRKSMLAIVFEVLSPAVAVTLEYVSGPSHPRLQRGAGSVTVGPTGPGVELVRLWITYETGSVGETISDTAVVRDPASGQQWTIQISANTVARRKAAAALVLDRSGSMTEDRGDGQKKVDSLREAASIFVDAMLQDDGVALVRFNQDAQLLAPVTALGSPADPSDPGRTAIKAIINGSDLDPGGFTSIGDGIFEGRAALTAASGFDVKSLVVLTDGIENQPKSIADVAASINEFTYSVGLGKPENISVAALQAISGNHGGYFLVTGAISGDNQFLLQKYFLQILAGINNAEVVLDPQGELTRDNVVVIPFQLTEADAGVDVYLLSPRAELIDFRVQTPSGYLLGPLEAPSHADVQYVPSRGVTYYRIRLPFEYMPQRFEDHGSWKAVLRLRGLEIRRGIGAFAASDPARDNPLVATGLRTPPSAAAPPLDRVSARSFPAVRVAQANTEISTVPVGVPYSVIVHAYSDLRLHATAHQSGTRPGEQITFDAGLTLFGVPIDTGLTVWADVSGRDGTRRIDLQNVNGRFTGTFTASVPDVNLVRLQATGLSPGGWPFHRELTLTAPAFFEQHGSGDQEGGISVLVLLPPSTLLPGGTVSVPYHFAFNARGGTPPYRFELAGGGRLPEGLSLSGAGVISGAPTARGRFNFAVTVHDSAGLSVQPQVYTVVIG